MTDNPKIDSMDKFHEALGKDADERQSKRKTALLREMDSREHSTREVEMMLFAENASRGKLFFDPEKVPAGKDYLWVVETLLGEAKVDNLQSSYYIGWRPVPAARHPEMIVPDFGGPLSNIDRQYIRRGGQILMERDKKIGDAERAIQQRRTDGQEDQVRSARFSQSNDPLTPHYSESKKSRHSFRSDD